MSYETIILEKKEKIATITLNRPEKLNAENPKMDEELVDVFGVVDKDNDVMVVVITGAGRAFCAGADVGTVATGAEMADDEPQRARLLQPVATRRLTTLILSLTKPTICALNGVVAGGPTAIPLCCDIIIASDQARFRISLTRMGLSLENGISYLLPRMVGPHLALELAYTNDVIDAKEMERIGLVNRVVPHDDLMRTAKEMAKKMFQIPPLTLALTKQCIYKGAAALDIESQMVFDSLVGRTLAQTEDQTEAQRSYIEKREPSYKGK